MKKFSLSLIVAFLALAATAFAQDAPPVAPVKGPVLNPQSFPGQFWTDTGNISPVEHNDIISASYFEQGVTLWRGNTMNFEALGSVGITADTKGYDWNNRIVGSTGGRFNKMISTKGIVELNVTYTYEDRWKSGATKGGFSPSATYWFGWQPVANQASRFPGSTWGAAGWLSPVERHNFIYNQYIKQGVVAKRFGIHSSLQPFGELTTSKDTKGFDWENYLRPGTGLEYVYTKGNTMTELGGEYLYEHRMISGMSAGGYSMFLKFWFGWNPIRKGAR
jgi:hypothetical protein